MQRVSVSIGRRGALSATRRRTHDSLRAGGAVAGIADGADDLRHQRGEAAKEGDHQEDPAKHAVPFGLVGVA